MNPRPAVLETVILPTELCPYIQQKDKKYFYFLSRFFILCTFKTTYRTFHQTFFLTFPWLKPRPISNSQLHTLPHFHLCPIYLVVLCTFKTTYRTFHQTFFLTFPWLKPRPISNSQLHTLPHFHLCPIYLVVFKGSY